MAFHIIQTDIHAAYIRTKLIFLFKKQVRYLCQNLVIYFGGNKQTSRDAKQHYI